MRFAIGNKTGGAVVLSTLLALGCKALISHTLLEGEGAR